MAGEQPRRKGSGPGAAPQGSGHGNEPAGGQEAFGQQSQTHGLVLGGPVRSWTR